MLRRLRHYRNRREPILESQPEFLADGAFAYHLLSLPDGYLVCRKEVVHQQPSSPGTLMQHFATMHHVEQVFRRPSRHLAHHWLVQYHRYFVSHFPLPCDNCAEGAVKPFLVIDIILIVVILYITEAVQPSFLIQIHAACRGDCPLRVVANSERVLCTQPI